MNFNDIRPHAENFRKSPDGKVWKKIDHLLSEKKDISSNIWKPNIKYAAAVVILMLSLVGYVQYSKNVLSSEFQLEIVKESEYFSPLYSTENMKSLQSAYHKKGFLDQQ